jgi:putative GTP pyrophosphokinase
MTIRTLIDAERALVEELMSVYEDAENQERLTYLLNSLRSLLGEARALGKLAHSFKSRLKDTTSLRDKLARQLVRDVDERHVPFHISRENLFTEINDLVGCRVLHLHTRQMQDIDPTLRKLFDDAPFQLLEAYPIAKIWDDESRKYFEDIGIKTESQPRMYSSVHYVIASNSRFRLTAEVQVRTLAQELWGEVDHKINYPHSNESLSCREQIRTLAWVASSCTRLVDSIFATHHDEMLQIAPAVSAPRGQAAPDSREPSREGERSAQPQNHKE